MFQIFLPIFKVQLKYNNMINSFSVTYVHKLNETASDR